MISHEHRCIFIHIPKCAGTSIESFLGHLDNHQGRGGQDHRSVRMIEQPLPLFESVSSRENLKELYRRQREPYRKVYNPKNTLQLTADQYRSYFKFTIVRNPWARAFSWYKNVKRDSVHLKRANLSPDISFKDFLKQFAGQGMLETQLYWLKDFSGDLNLDFIGRFESLADDFRIISKAIGLPTNVLPHKMKGDGMDYRQVYDTESHDMIADIYKEEIALFGYSFDFQESWKNRIPDTVKTQAPAFA